MCQQCPESRCLACRGQGPPKLGLSMAEQIEQYERLNAEDQEYRCCCQGRCEEAGETAD
jgi:hypothetical protein